MLARPRRAVPVLLLAVLAALVPGPGPTSAAGAAVSGRVGLGDGTPVPGACVVLLDTAVSPTRELRAIRTGSDGRYRIEGVPAGVDYLLRVSAGDGCERTTSPPDIGTAFNGGGYDTLGPRFAVPDDGAVAVDVVVPRAAHLRGRVLDRATLQPLGRIHVLPLGTNASSVGSLTADDGTYDVGGLSPGRYQVQYADLLRQVHLPVYHPDAPLRSGAQTLEVREGQELTLDALMDRGMRVSGRVTDEQGRPQADAAVTLFRDDPCCEQAGPAYTAADGTWTVTGVRAGDQRIRVDAPRSSGLVGQWRGGVTRQGARPTRVDGDVRDVDTVLSEGGRLAGSVTAEDDGEPLGQVCVLAEDSTGQPLLGTTATGVTNGGTYLLAGLRPGRYAVRYVGCGSDGRAAVRFHGGATRTHTARVVDVAAGRTTQLPQEQLVVGGALRGAVRTDDGARLPFGTQVEAFREGQPRVQALVQPGGTYALDHLAPGTWQVRVLGCGGAGYTTTAGVPAEVEAGETGVVDEQVLTTRTGTSCPEPAPPSGLRVRAGGGSLAVRWVPPAPDTLAPATGYTVTVLPDGPRTYVLGGDSDGVVLSGLPAGEPVSVSVRADRGFGGGPCSALAPTGTPEPGPETEPSRPDPGDDGTTCAPRPTQEPSPSPTPVLPVLPPLLPPVLVSPTPTPGPSAEPTATPQPPDPGPAPQPRPAPRLSLSTSTLSAGQPTTVTYRGEPFATVDVLSRTQPATAFSRVARLVLDADGRGTTTHRPQRNTRLTARSADGTASVDAPLVSVRSVASFRAERVRPRTYVLTGRVYPALNGRLVNVYRGGKLLAQARSDRNGVYTTTRTLTAGVADLEVRTGDDTSNLGTRSGTRRVVVR